MYWTGWWSILRMSVYYEAIILIFRIILSESRALSCSNIAWNLDCWLSRVYRILQHKRRSDRCLLSLHQRMISVDPLSIPVLFPTHLPVVSVGVRVTQLFERHYLTPWTRVFLYLFHCGILSYTTSNSIVLLVHLSVGDRDNTCDSPDHNRHRTEAGHRDLMFRIGHMICIQHTANYISW